MKNSILNINVSCFQNCRATTPADVSLLAWLTSDKHRDKVEQIRTLQDEMLQKEIKKTLPAITPSGRFSLRNTQHLVGHSGFLAFDIDFQDNRHIVNFNDLKQQISHISSVAYCGLSVRGHGFWGLVPVPASTPQEHKKRFEALAKDFEGFGIILDKSGSDVCRLRIYSWDPDAYFNHQAQIYTKTLQVTRPSETHRRPEASDARERVEAVIAKIKENQVDITESYDNWLRIGAALANEFGESGRGYFHAVSQFHPDYSPGNVDKKFDTCVKDRMSRISIGTFFHIAEDHGIRIAPGSGRAPATYQAAESSTKPSIPSASNEKELNVAAPYTPQKNEKPRPEVIERVLPDVWGVVEIENFFRSRALPSGPIRLDGCTVINDVQKFIQAELSIVKAHNGQYRYRPYFARLQQLKIALS
jgi:hypothetical protein